MKLNWKKRWLDDKSGYWYSAKVPFIGWEYIVETNEKLEYICFMFLSNKSDEDIRISKKAFKTKEAAITVCEKHLNDIAKKFDKWYKTK